jgi:acetoin utilization protein AcuC
MATETGSAGVSPALPVSVNSIRMRPTFYYHPRMLEYDFGPQHPFRPERLVHCVELLGRYGIEPVDPGTATEEDALRVHSAEYIDTFKKVDASVSKDEGLGLDKLSDRDFEASPVWKHGFATGDNPPFSGMWQAALNFMGGTIRAAEDVRDGAQMALTLGGGLHHCSRDRASGFCLLDDPAIACAILREKFDRVAYVDIDLHHGDGVQWIWYDNPSVLTCSIHETGRTLFPGTGFSEETGAQFTSLNVPLEAHTTGDVWLDAFRQGILPALERFQPQAIVLQMGSDPHFSDPLGHLMVAEQDWIEAVRDIKNLGLPLVATGGGGYFMGSVIRMWSAAILELSGIDYPDELPEDLARSWELPTFSDLHPPGPFGSGAAFAERSIRYIEDHHLKEMPTP